MLITLAVLAQLADLAVFYAVASGGGIGFEVNPIARAAYQWDPLAVVAFKLGAITLLVAGCLWLIRVGYPRMAQAVAVITLVLGTIGALSVLTL